MKRYVLIEGPEESRASAGYAEKRSCLFFNDENDETAEQFINELFDETDGPMALYELVEKVRWNG